jgi:hypothetical protein
LLPEKKNEAAIEKLKPKPEITDLTGEISPNEFKNFIMKLFV